MLVDVRRARDRREDYYTARIVAMVAAVNAKNHKYDPRRYMLDGRAIQQEQAAARARGVGLTGEQVLARFKALGVPIIDKRNNR